jgi:alcohol dehydrogenase class IV
VTADVLSARLEWQEAYRQLDDALREAGQPNALGAQLDLLVRELRKRVGSAYTLADLGAEYRHADRWVRDVVGERAPAPGWPRSLALVEGAAFHVVSLGAVDYEP